MEACENMLCAELRDATRFARSSVVDSECETETGQVLLRLLSLP